MKKLLLPLVSSVVILSCSKKQDVQPYEYQDIKGQIFNTCNDSGVKGTINIIYPWHDQRNQYTPTQVSDLTTDTNGNFNFTRWPIYKGETYTLTPLSNYYTNTGHGSSIAFNGDNASQFFKFNVIPQFHTLQISSNHTSVTSHSDSVSFFMSQNILHKNMPDSSYTNTLKIFGDQAAQQTFILSNKPMGLWHITIDKWVSGVHSTIQDSIYLNYWAIKTYTVNW